MSTPARTPATRANAPRPDPTPGSSRRFVLFDDGLSDFGPLSLTRLAFEHRTGAFTQLERVAAAGGRVLAITAPRDLWAVHRDRCAERYQGLGGEMPGRREAPETVFLLHGLAGASHVSEVLGLRVGEQLTDASGRLVGASCADLPSALAWAEAGARQNAASPARQSQESLPRRPWELLDQLPARLAQDLTALLGQAGSAAANPGGQAGAIGAVFVHPTAAIESGAVLDGREGVVAILEGARIGANAVIQGPCVIGAHSRISPHGLVKPNTVIGPNCRVGCEIGGSIVYGHTNAVHHGHIGDSIIGEWANIGAGTCISNLLNTYGEVVGSLGPSSPRHPTGRTHYGGIIGDHAKVAILVAIPTGFSIGVGSMVAVGRAPQTVPDFAWLAPDRTATHRLDRFLQTESTMMSRRQVAMGPAYRAFLESLHRARTDG